MATKPGKAGRFGSDYRLQGLSIAEIVTPFEEAVLRVGVRYQDRQGRRRKLKPGKVLNALVLAFLELDPAEQERRALAALARLEEFQESLGAGDDAADDGPAADAPRPPGSSVGHPAPRPGERRRRSG